MITLTTEQLNAGIIEAMFALGAVIIRKDNEWVIESAHTELQVQNFIDAYNPLAEEKAKAISVIKFAGAKAFAAVYPFIDPESEEAVGLYEFARDLYLSIVPAGREPLSGGLLQLKTIYDTATAGIATVNAQTDWTQCEVVASQVVASIEAL